MESTASEASKSFSTTPRPNKKYMNANDPHSLGVIRILTNLFSIKPNEEYTKDVYLYAIVAEQKYPQDPLANDKFPVGLIKEVKRKSVFKDELNKNFTWYYISGLLLFAKIKKDTPEQFETAIKISPENVELIDLKDESQPLNEENCKIYHFSFIRKKTISSYSNGNANEKGFNILYRNYINIVIGKLLGEVGYNKDTTTRKILYYKKEDAQKPALLGEGSRDHPIFDLYFFPALKAVSDIYENNKIFFKILPKNILRSQQTYLNFYEFLLEEFNDFEKAKTIFKNKAIQQGRGLKVYNMKNEKIEDVIFANPYELFFKKNDESISVGEYLTQVYPNSPFQIKQTIQPIAVRYIDKGGKIPRDQCQKLYIPMGLLYMVGNVMETKINVRDLIESPYVKYRKIMEVRKQLQVQYEREVPKDQREKESIEKCVEFDLKSLEVTGHVLQMPTIRFKENTKTISEKGTFDVIGTEPRKQIKFDNILLYLVGLNNSIGECMYNKLIEAGESMKISLPVPGVLDHTKYFQKQDPSEIENDLVHFFSNKKKNIEEKKEKIDVILYFIDQKYQKAYKIIKNALNKTELPVPSQVIVYNKRKMESNKNLSLFTNVLSQIYGKKSEELFSVDFSFAKDTIVMAYSVMKYKDKKVITSLCTSVTSSKVEYVFYSDISEKNDSNISPVIEKLAKKALVAIWKYQKHPIKKIIVYREGVNDKQIPTITQFELPQFRKGFNKALEEIKNYKDDKDAKKKYEDKKKNILEAKICFVIVNKINEIKMFYNQSNEKGSNLNYQEIVNVPLGTLVDRDVVSAEYYDFHLNSAYSDRGSSNMTKYTVVFDETELTASELYRITYYLTYMSYNTTKSIKVPAPLYFVTRRNKYTRDCLDSVISNKCRLLNISL